MLAAKDEEWFSGKQQVDDLVKRRLMISVNGKIGQPFKPRYIHIEILQTGVHTFP